MNNTMEKIIAACGNDCAVCPRHLPKTDEELHHTAELWHKIGYRDHVVTNEEISCHGCTSDNWCRYQVVKCTEEKNIANCGECAEYPCKTIMECFEVAMTFEPMCRKICTDSEYMIMKKAFFEKQENLENA